MSELQSLLVELGTEELPPKALDELARAFADGICNGLAQHGITTDAAHAETWCTPRRLAVLIPAVATTQPEQHIERRGPAVNSGRDANGQPTKALVGFARSCGIDADALDTVKTDKGAWYVYRAVKPGQATAILLPAILEDTLKQLPIPRRMRWGDHDYSFVRPVHWLVMLHGDQVVPATIMGLSSGRQSFGHRFHHPDPITINHADNWLQLLRDAHVEADPVKRRDMIRAEVDRVATGGVPRLDNALLEELANLAEWPQAIACTFDRDFLAVPQEALISTMVANQKFIPVFDADGSLSEHFIGIANIDSHHPDAIRQGYERVIRPRFEDARFFYREDLKTPLADLQPKLADVTYQQALGSLWDKTCRVAELARTIAGRVGVDGQLATQAASLCKCDLLTLMVGEFPELQGIMGRHYAAAHGHDKAVALALDEYYMPRHASDRIAEGDVSRVLAIAERADTLVGIFAIGLKPSGNKDPFALRRAALGLVRTLVEGNLDLDLEGLLREALELIPDSALGAARKSGKKGKQSASATPTRQQLCDEIMAFILERLRSYYLSAGFQQDAFEAVASVSPRTLVDFDRRLRAVTDFAAHPAAAALAAANKRVSNILHKQADIDGTTRVDDSLFTDAAESALATALDEARHANHNHLEKRDYAAALTRLAQLREPVDTFFDEVMVMADDIAVRDNRLALLRQLNSSFLTIADVSRLQSEG